MRVLLLIGLIFSGTTACAWGEKSKSIADSTSLEESLAGKKPEEIRAIHHWLAKEMVERVFARQVKDERVLLPWLNILNQGASVEGLYRGLVLSDEYSKLEKGVVNIEALRFAAQELALLKLNKLHPDEESKAQMEGMMPKLMNASFFTLKRELGDRLLSALEKRKNDKQARAIWFAVYAARWSGEKVDFGLSERNSDSEVFHKDWAERNSYGLMQWELLNKMHRIMNFKNGLRKNKKPESKVANKSESKAEASEKTHKPLEKMK